MEDRCKVESKELDGVTVIEVTLTTTQVDEIEMCTNLVRFCLSSANYIIDLDHVGFLTDVLQAALLLAHRSVHRKGRTLHFCNLAPGVQEVIDAGSLRGQFSIFDTREQAIVAMN